MTAVGVLGPGRVGLGLGLALARAGYHVRAHGRTPKPLPPQIEGTFGGMPTWIPQVGIVLVTVPDDAIALVAGQLQGVGPGHTVLHASGVLDRTALSALESTGAALGSLHPLQTISDPLSAADRFRGAVAVIEGDDRAVKVASELARAVGLTPVEIPSASKAAYHAAGVFGSNYVVVLAGVARRLLEESGMPREMAWPALLSLLRGAVDNLAASGPEGALTGPVARGDTESIRRHLAALEGNDADLYRLLGRAALELARLDPARKAAIEKELS